MRVGFDGEFPPSVEAAGGEVDGADNCALFVRQNHLRVQLEAFERMNFGAHIVHYSQSPHSFHQLVFFQSVRRPRQDMQTHSAHHGAHQPLDDDRVLVPLILQPEGVFCGVDEIGYPLAPVVGAPDELRVPAGAECRARPIGLETCFHFGDLGFVCRDHRVIARDGQVPRLPIEGFHKTGRSIDHH